MTGGKGNGSRTTLERDIVRSWMRVQRHCAYREILRCGSKVAFGMRLKSADLPIGVPFNIASYALLLALVANEVNMVPDEYIHTLGDTHIYSNQLTGVKEMLARESRPHPRLVIKAPPRTSIFDIKVDDIEVLNYDPHPFIKIPVAK